MVAEGFFRITPDYLLHSGSGLLSPTSVFGETSMDVSLASDLPVVAFLESARCFIGRHGHLFADEPCRSDVGLMPERFFVSSSGGAGDDADCRFLLNLQLLMVSVTEPGLPPS